MTKRQPTLAELRAAAYKAVADHERDMARDPEYRTTVEKIEREVEAKAAAKAKAIAKAGARAKRRRKDRA